MSAKRAPPAAPASLTRAPTGYAEWIADVKQRGRAAQMRASLAVNHELIALYWSIGRDLLERRAKSTWGDGVIDRASADLRAEFPNMEGFSRSNLKYMRQFAEAWPDVDQIGQQPVGQLPWSTNLVLLTSAVDSQIAANMTRPRSACCSARRGAACSPSTPCATR